MVSAGSILKQIDRVVTGEGHRAVLEARMILLQLVGDSLLNEVVKQQAQINQTVLKVLDLVLQQQRILGQGHVT